MSAGTLFDLREFAAKRRVLVDERLDELVAGREPAELWQSMRYSVLSGGKRIRALLCLAAAEAVCYVPDRSNVPVAWDKALSCACALETIHAMSLIHDDLPCMDNDDLRRGKPTNHKVFGEAMALLAGDALLAYATEILVRHTPPSVPPEIILDVAAELARATGPEGMVGGQVADCIATGLITGERSGTTVSRALLESIHKRKTGALLRFSVWSGARLAGAPEHILAALAGYGQILGLAFQIADDLLDVTGDAQTLGKTPGKDEAAGKLTWVALHGIENSRLDLQHLEAEGKSLLRDTGLPIEATLPLESLLNFAINRNS